MKTNKKRIVLYILSAALIVGVIIFVASFFIEDPLRRYMVDKVNSRLKGYSIQVEKMDLHPLRFAVTYQNARISQDAYPVPPVVHVQQLYASIHWRALLDGKLVSDIHIEQPDLHIEYKQLAAEQKDQTPVKESGWQEAIKEINPFKINMITVNNGKLVYLDTEKSRPIRISNMMLRAENIRNIRSAERTYPSEFQMQATVFDQGRVEFNGNANFLSAPHAGFSGRLVAETIHLDHFASIARRYHVALQKGVLKSAEAQMEYSPHARQIHVKNADVQNLHADFVYAGAPAEEQVKETVQEAGKKQSEDELSLHVDQFHLSQSELGFVNEKTDPQYRLFISGTDLEVGNYSNGFAQGPSKIRLRGKFMGTGPMVVYGTFRPEQNGPDFNINVAIERAKVRTMNDLLRAYANLDVVSGLFFLYSEVRVENQRINGYIKPLFRNIDVYGEEQEEHDSIFQKVYEGIAGALAELLENQPRDEVATRTDLSGRIENPQANTWEILQNLVQNAFFDTIIPGFEDIF